MLYTVVTIRRDKRPDSKYAYETFEVDVPRRKLSNPIDYIEEQLGLALHKRSIALAVPKKARRWLVNEILDQIGTW